MDRMMIDFETLDTDATGVVLSAGVCIFDESKIKEDWYFTFHVGGQIAQGRTVSPETVLWWAQTNPEELRKLCTSGGDKLEGFIKMTKSLLRDYGIREIWSRGSMDFLMLCDIMEEDAPPYYMARDVRTLDSLKIAKMGANGHNALEDARNQVKYVQEVLCNLKWMREKSSSAQCAEE